MRSLLTGRSPNAFAMLLSMSLLLVAAISAATGFRADIFVLASYSVAIFHGWRYKRPGLADTLHIEGSGVPAYVQIRDQVLKAIGAGIIKPGEKMPTMRQVAVALRIDLNAVRHAYDALAQAGAITIQPARGTFVAEKPPKASEAERLAALIHQSASARAKAFDPVKIAQHAMLIEEGKEACS